MVEALWTCRGFPAVSSGAHKGGQGQALRAFLSSESAGSGGGDQQHTMEGSISRPRTEPEGPQVTPEDWTVIQPGISPGQADKGRDPAATWREVPGGCG